MCERNRSASSKTLKTGLTDMVDGDFPSTDVTARLAGGVCIAFPGGDLSSDLSRAFGVLGVL